MGIYEFVQHATAQESQTARHDHLEVKTQWSKVKGASVSEQRIALTMTCVCVCVCVCVCLTGNGPVRCVSVTYDRCLCVSE